MAFSWNWPQLARPIKDDVPAISAMFNAAVRLNPEYGGGTDLASGMKRLVAVTNGYQLQNFSGSAWASLGKLMHDVDKLDGYHASTTAVKNTIPVYNANALLPGGITGNAATATKLKTARALQVGGIASGEAVNFDGSAPVTLTVDRITVNNEADDAVNGVLTTAHGGTGRTDGAAQDVRVASLSGEVNASDYGQVGRAVRLTASMHLDSLVVDGNYACDGGQTFTTVENGYPRTATDSISMTVRTVGAFVWQQIVLSNTLIWHRRSNNSGQSWAAWQSSCGTMGSRITLYVSKSGSDNNTGLSADYPVQTIARAIRIAMGLNTGTSDQPVRLLVGEGEWGNVIFRDLPFWLRIYPYDGAIPTMYSESLPMFTKLQVYGSNVELAGVVIDKLTAYYQSYVYIGTGYKRMGAIEAAYNSTVSFASDAATTNLWEIHSQTQDSGIVSLHDGGRLTAYRLHIRLADNITATQFINIYRTGYLSMVNGSTIFDASDYMVTGLKFRFDPGSVAISQEKSGAMDFFTSTLPGTGYTLANGAIVNGYTVGQAAQADLEALDAAVVKLTGSQTIAGEKTFTANATVSKSDPCFVLKNTSVTRGTAPSSAQYSQLRMIDTNGQLLGDIRNQVFPDNTIKTYISAYGASAGAQMQLGVSISGDGSVVYGYAPTTPAGSTDNQIVTADYLLSANSGVVHTVRNETVAGVKTFTSNPVVSVAAPNFVLKQTDADRATVPTSDQYCQMQMQDKNGKVMGNICNMQLTSGASRTFMNAYNSTGTAATVGVQYPAGDGAVPYGYAPNPAASSNSNHIATTAWVRAMRFNGAAPASDRSVLIPPMLDDSMMTLLYENESGLPEGDITLSQPYTDFAALCILYGGDTSYMFLMTGVVSVWELEQRKNAGATFTLFNGYKFWECKSATSTTTFFDHYDDNARVYKIWGIN